MLPSSWVALYMNILYKQGLLISEQQVTGYFLQQ